MPDKNGNMPGQPGYMTPEEEAKYAVDPSTDVSAPIGRAAETPEQRTARLYAEAHAPQTDNSQAEKVGAAMGAQFGDYRGAANVRLYDENGNPISSAKQSEQRPSFDPQKVLAGGDYVDPETGKTYIAQHNTVGNIAASGDIAGVGGSFKYVDPNSPEGKAEIANRLASFRGESDAFVRPDAKVNKQITPEMQAALNAQTLASLKQFQNTQTPLDVTRANIANAQQQALMNQLQASRRQGSIAQLQGATSFGKNINQAGVGAGRGALASRAALRGLTGAQSNVAGGVGQGVGKEQAAISSALAQQLGAQRGAGLATNDAANRALLQQKQNALTNYIARSGAFQSGEQARKSQEIQNLLRAYRMAGNDAAQKAALEQRIIGAIGTTASTIAGAF